MKKIIFVLCITLIGTMHCYFEKYRAQKAYKQGDTKQAQYLLDEILTQEPDNAEVAYNLGKVALKEKEFNKAVAYFNCAKQSASASALLREQAWYDLGISQVHMKQWEEALASFQEVLKINPENEYAQKMIDQIKKILDQKKEQEQEQKQDQQSKDDQKDDDQKKQDKQKNDSDKNDQKKDGKDDDSDKDEQNKDDSSENKEQDSSSQKDEKSDEENKSDKDSKQDGDEQEKQQPQEDNNKNKKNNADKNQNDSDDRSNENSQNQQPELKQQDEQKSGQKQPSQKQPEQALQEAKNDGKNDKQAQQQPADKETMLLQLVEKHDAQMSKALFKRQIQQQMPSRHGQKNW